jgi:hypothetical protein
MNNNNKNSLIKNRSLFSETDNIQNQLVKNHQTNQRYCSFNNLTNLGNKFNKESPIKLQNKNKNKNLNIINFIKQKKRFFIENSFDNKGTIQFLASKEIAMRVIKLDDEIIDKNINKKKNKNKNKNLTNKDIIKLEFMDIDDNTFNNLENHKSSKAAGKRTISPRKSRKTSKRIISQKDILKIENKKTKKSKKSKKTKNLKNNNNSLIANTNQNSDKKNFIIFDKESNDSHSNIYKFFIDNANEPEENFQKKLKKELKKVENIKNKKKAISRKDLKLGTNRLNSVSIRKNKDYQSVFRFSEISKNLMINDDINVSSIDENNDSLRNKTNKKRSFGSVQYNNKQIKERIKKKISKDIYDDKDNNNKIKSKIEINSDKDSIISILSDLM